MNQDSDFAYDSAMRRKGFAICIFPAAQGRVCYSYEPLERAGRQIGWRTYPNGERLPVHAVKHMEGDSLEALGRLKSRAQTFQDATTERYA